MPTDWIVSGRVNISDEIRQNPEHAIRVLLETGALEHLANWHEDTTPGRECWHMASGEACTKPDAGRMIPLYRLVTEGSDNR